MLKQKKDIQQKYTKFQSPSDFLKEIEIINTKSYCWRNDLVSRYESLWSLLHKFALLNAIGSSDIRAIFGRTYQQRHIDTFWRWNNRADMRYLNGVDTAKLAVTFNLNEQLIRESAVSTFLRQDEIQSLSSKTLRYCKKCLEEGFHSSLYQLEFIAKCPIHEKRFNTKCPKCNKTISYRIDKNAFIKPYGCPECNTMLCKKLLKVGCHLPTVKGREEQLKLVSDWLLERVKAEILEASVKTESNIASIRKRSYKTVSNLPNYWIEIFKPSNELKTLLSKQLILSISSGESFHVKTCFKSLEDNNKKEELISSDWDSELYSIYKSVSRHFIKTQLFNHIKCINKYGQNLWWDRNAVTSTGKICEFANAYIIWRMYLEGISHPIDIFKKFGKRFRYGFSRPNIYWYPPSYNFSKSILKRIFALECYWLFYECKLLARTFSLLNIYSFNTRYVTSSFIPHWIIRINDENFSKSCEFHRWIQPEELKEISEIRQIH